MERDCGSPGLFGAQLRRMAKRSRDGGQARRLLAIAAALDGARQAEAAKAGGMDRQTLS